MKVILVEAWELKRIEIAYIKDVSERIENWLKLTYCQRVQARIGCDDLPGRIRNLQISDADWVSQLNS